MGGNSFRGPLIGHSNAIARLRASCIALPTTMRLWTGLRLLAALLLVVAQRECVAVESEVDELPDWAVQGFQSWLERVALPAHNLTLATFESRVIPGTTYRGMRVTLAAAAVALF